MDILVKDKKYILTNHVLYRMEKRGISVANIEEALGDIRIDRIKRATSEIEQDRRMVAGKNKITIILTIEDNIIVTVYKYKREYYAAKSKSNFNKKRRGLKQLYGNRLKR